MKSFGLIGSFIILASLSVHANANSSCPDFNGTYKCSESGEEYMMLIQQDEQTIRLDYMNDIDFVYQINGPKKLITNKNSFYFGKQQVSFCRNNIFHVTTTSQDEEGKLLTTKNAMAMRANQIIETHTEIITTSTSEQIVKSFNKVCSKQ